MRIQIMSDLHLEFHKDGGAAFVKSMDQSLCDVLVLAGDICTLPTMERSLGMICERYDSKPVIWVHGNHEYYGSNRYKVRDMARFVPFTEDSPLYWLECDSVFLGERGVTPDIHGATLWFPETPEVIRYRDGWSDYRAINGLTSWVHESNAAAVEYLVDNVKAGDIVVTHHLPSAMSIGPKWRSSHENCFFLTDLHEFIEERQPALWVHGHTHDSFDYRIGKTRVVCNPYGYHGHEVNPCFNRNLIVEV